MNEGQMTSGSWAIDITIYTGMAISLFGSLMSLMALLSCALQKPSNFPAVGPLSKGAWLAILAGTTLLGTLFSRDGSGLGIFGLIALIAALVYLLDIRPAIRDLGSDPW